MRARRAILPLLSRTKPNQWDNFRTISFAIWVFYIENSVKWWIWFSLITIHNLYVFRKTISKPSISNNFAPALTNMTTMSEVLENIVNENSSTFHHCDLQFIKFSFSFTLKTIYWILGRRVLLFINILWFNESTSYSWPFIHRILFVNYILQCIFTVEKTVIKEIWNIIVFIISLFISTSYSIVLTNWLIPC